MEKYTFELEFTEPILGATPKSEEVYRDYIASKAALTDKQAAEELETVENAEEKGWTGFHTDDERPFLYDYVVKGFLKDACGMLRRASGTKSSKLTAYRKVIDGLVFVEPRKILLDLPQGATLGVLERPLRAQTAQGERVALARSDTCPPGTTISFTLTVLGGVTMALLNEWFEYGQLRGLGQWRNAGYGRFTYTLAKQ